MMQDEKPAAVRRGLARPLVPGDDRGTKSPFWQADPRAQGGLQPVRAGTVTFEFTKNYKFTVLNNENVWAKAMSRVVNDNVSVEKATDEMIARIKQVAGS
jgi:multiple sugar transport system substrate-binding protein